MIWIFNLGSFGVSEKIGLETALTVLLRTDTKKETKYYNELQSLSDPSRPRVKDDQPTTDPWKTKKPVLIIFHSMNALKKLHPILSGPYSQAVVYLILLLSLDLVFSHIQLILNNRNLASFSWTQFSFSDSYVLTDIRLFSSVHMSILDISHLRV